MKEFVEKFRQNGVYLLKNVEVARPSHMGKVVQPIVRFKVKNTRPVLYFCRTQNSLSGDRLDLYRLNGKSQFADVDHTPHQNLHASPCREGVWCYPHDFRVEDFVFLGVEDGVGNVTTYWGSGGIFIDSKRCKELMDKWEKEAIKQGHFTPEINPLYKSKLERQQREAKDFFGNTIKIGDKVAYVKLSGYQHIRIGVIRNITDRSVSIERERGESWKERYVCSPTYVIKCPEGFKG